jgi:hypothetical protein
LREYLNGLGPGPHDGTTDLERLLVKVWDMLGGDESGMTGQKLVGRIEHVEWYPPMLSFLIERHGGTVLGSTRAGVQRWSVDLDRQTATCKLSGHRQVCPMARRVDVGPIADEIAESILVGEADERLTWLGEGLVRVEAGKIVPANSGYKQTIQGRRQRVKEAVIERLTGSGWNHLGRNTFGR